MMQTTAEIEIRRTIHDDGRSVVESCTVEEATWDGSTLGDEPGWVVSRFRGSVLAYRHLTFGLATVDGRERRANRDAGG